MLLRKMCCAVNILFPGLQFTAPSLVQEDLKLGFGRVGAEAAGFVRFPSRGIKHLNALFPNCRGLEGCCFGTFGWVRSEETVVRAQGNAVLVVRL